MPKTNKTITTFNGGVLAKEVQGRIELPIYNKSMDMLSNWYALPEGGGDYRNGHDYVKYTRLNKAPWLIPFIFSDQQSYALEFTHRKLRFLYEDSVLVEAPKTITGMTNANPGVFTSNAHGFNNGDEIFLAGFSYLDNISSQFYLVDNVTTNTFTLTDVFGTALNTVTVGAFGANGTAARVYEIDTPYDELDLQFLQTAQNADVMYITHNNYKQRKLTRKSHTNWELNTYAITGDPFVSTSKNITGITNASPAVVTSAAHGFIDGQIIYITGSVGMTEVNSNFYIVRNVTTNTFSLEDRYGVAINSTTFGVWTSGGVATTPDKYPRACNFDPANRLVFGGTRANPATLFFSAAPSAGNTDYDNFTQGLTQDTNAVTLTLGPVQGKVDIIQWISNTGKFLVVGTFSTIRRVFGDTEQAGVTPTKASAKPVNSYGCAQVIPIANGDSVFYVQRGYKRLRSFEYDISVDGYDTIDRNLVAKHVSIKGIRQVIEQIGDPDLMWCVMSDGKLGALTYKRKEDISGWSTHKISGRHVTSNGVTRNWGKVLCICSLPRPNTLDRLWMCVERVINGRTVRSLEYMSDRPVFADRRDFLTFDEEDTEGTNEAVDTALWENAVYENQKDYAHLDMSSFYDGSAVGVAAKADITPGVIAKGDSGVFTSTNPVFDATMIGREIWKAYDENGVGGGRAVITGFTDSTHVTCTVKVAFNSNAQIKAGAWYLTTALIKGLKYLEGEVVDILVDGATSASTLVTNGRLALLSQHSKVRVGLKYTGVMRTLNLDMGGTTGPAAAKERKVTAIKLGLVNTLGIRFGTSLYRTEQAVFRTGATRGSRPTPPFNGIFKQGYQDGPNELDKRVTIIQNTPVSATVISIDVTADTSDEQQPS